MGQSPTADRMNLGILRVWEQLRWRIQLLAQLHDAVYFQYRETDDEVEIMTKVKAICEIAVSAPNGRRFVVPGEAKVGWNQSKHHDPSKPLNPKTNPWNPNGLMKWKGQRDTRKRLSGIDSPI